MSFPTAKVHQCVLEQELSPLGQEIRALPWLTAQYLMAEGTVCSLNMIQVEGMRRPGSGTSHPCKT